VLFGCSRTHCSVPRLLLAYCVTYLVPDAPQIRAMQHLVRRGPATTGCS
jgi:hypothetical protein